MSKANFKKLIWVLALAGLLCFSLLTEILYSYSKNTMQIQVISDSEIDNKSTHRIADFDISIDGKPDDTVYFKAYATTKLSDIEVSDSSYIAHSFVPDAYQVHKISVTNNSETTVKCFLQVNRLLNDERIFYVILPDSNSILEDLYTKADLSTSKKVKEYTDSISYTNSILKIGETKTFTMVIWAEHDSVFPDKNGDGKAEENTQNLAELTYGIPTEKFILNYSFEQVD